MICPFNVTEPRSDEAMAFQMVEFVIGPTRKFTVKTCAKSLLEGLCSACTEDESLPGFSQKSEVRSVRLAVAIVPLMMSLLLAVACLVGCMAGSYVGKPSPLPNSDSLDVSSSPLPSGMLQTKYSAAITATGGAPPYAWSMVSGELPPGLTLNSSDGTIAGTPTASGTFSFVAKAEDSKGFSASAGLAMIVRAPPLQITTNGLPAGTILGSYGASLAAAGGVPPYSWSITTGELPAGINLKATTGSISGTPTSAGTFSFTTKVLDSNSSSARTNLSLNVSLAPAPAISAVSPDSGSAEGGSAVIIEGANFRSGAVVHFGTALASSSQVLNPSEIQATTPAQASGPVNVTVENSDGQVATAPKAFTFTTSGPSDPTANADVVVDASQTISETGGDDLAAAKNIYASASAPESDGGLYPDWDLIASEFVMKRMRNINGLGDCALDNTGKLTGCSRLNNDLQNMKYRGLTPHVVVGQWAPSSIGGDPRQWGTAQWAEYDALCYAIVNYVVNQYGGTGFSQAVFEVENEMDTTTDPRDLWLTTTPNVPQGEASRFVQFDTVYRHWAKAVDLVARQTPSKTILIAGPATGFWTVYYGSGQLWHDQIVQKYAAAGVRLDVVSLHIYGGEVNDLAKYAQSIRQTLIASGNPKAQIWVTEWGPSDSGDSYFGAINGSQQGAAWGIYFLLQALKGTITGGSFLEVRDNQGHDTLGVDADMFSASWNHVENGVEYPKAIANAFSMVNLMSGTRKSVTVDTARPDLRGFGSSDSTSASLIVANYDYLFDYAHKNYSDLSKSESVAVAFKNLPFSGPVKVDRYLIDADTSNLDYWVASGKTPPSVKATELQEVESFSANATDGTLTLPARQLGPSAVSLWIVHQ
jgi:IPT/TIG domain/Putative Ig domain/Glycosyl hydrolase catalytic core